MSDFSEALEEELLGAVERLSLANGPAHKTGASKWLLRPRRRVLAFGAATLVVAGALAVSLVGLGSEAPRAFAGWSPTPADASNGRVARVSAVCRARLVSRLAQRRREATSRPELGEIGTFPTTGWHAVLADTRGPYMMVVLEQGNERGTSTCFAGRHGEVSDGWGIRNPGAPPPPPVAPGHVAYRSSGATGMPRAEGAHLFSYVVGRTGAGVRGVTVRLNNGTRVTATTMKGWFLAWWPGSHGIRATEVTTASGTTVE
jgi:hypothetical protein